MGVGSGMAHIFFWRTRRGQRAFTIRHPRAWKAAPCRSAAPCRTVLVGSDVIGYWLVVVVVFVFVSCFG